MDWPAWAQNVKEVFEPCKTNISAGDKRGNSETITPGQLPELREA